MTSSTAQHKSQSYRPDIDGLRAVAVLSVILYHINESILPGGFVGVDIFFVISGYLISLHILRDIEKGQFSLVEFYRRRVKRIAPAMLVVIAVTIFLAQFFFRPPDAEKVAESGLWSLLSLANVYFWLFQDTSYFAADSNELPLLHLWSLGVEEQFYIFWPLILMFVYRGGSGKLFFFIFSIIAIASYILGEALFDLSPSFVYYMLPTRAGELLVGALAAYIVLKQESRQISSTIVAIVSFAGLLLIFGSLFLISEQQVFPGLSAIPPTVGTAMLILAGHYGTSWTGRMLMLRPMIWVGVISYSAYLWHWPILAFYRYSQPEPEFVHGLLMFAVTIILAWLSYRYIETPARKSTRPAISIFTRQFILPVGFLAFFCLLFMKLDGYGLRWISDDYRADLAALKNQIRPAYDYDYVCQKMVIKAEDVLNQQCIVGAESAEQVKTLLWGDSNAAHYIGMLGVFAREQGFRFMNLEAGACPPIHTDPEDFVSVKRIVDCRVTNTNVWGVIDNYQVVIISSNWTYYQSQSAQFLDVFYRTVRDLTERGKLVILIGKAPIISTYDRLCREKALSFPYMKCEVPDVPLSAEVADINNKLKDFAANTQNAEYYDITEYLCPHGSCSVFNKNRDIIYYDSSHLTLSGSWQIGEEIVLNSGVPFPFDKIKNWQPVTQTSRYE